MKSRVPTLPSGLSISNVAVYGGVPRIVTGTFTWLLLSKIKPVVAISNLPIELVTKALNAFWKLFPLTVSNVGSLTVTEVGSIFEIDGPDPAGATIRFTVAAPRLNDPFAP